MSDTQAKIDKRRKEVQKQKAKNQRRANAKVKYSTKVKIRNIAITVVVCLLAIAVIVPNLSFNKRLLTALTVGDTKFSSAEFSYSYINSFYNYYNTMVSYMGEQYVGISTTTSLRKQEMSEGMTYADYFVDMATSELTQMAVLSGMAEKAGFELNDEQKKEYEEILDSVKAEAEYYGYSLNKYLKEVYGAGFNQKSYERLTYMGMVASAYQEHLINSYEYSKEDLEKYYEEHKNDYDKLTIRYQKFGVSEATSTKEAVTLEDARETAEKFMNKVVDSETFSAAALEYLKSQSEKPDSVTTESTLKEDTTYSTLASTSEALAKWAVDEDREAGDLEIITLEKDAGYIVAYMVETAAREEYNTVDVRHILINVDAEEKDDDYSKKKIEAKKEIDAILKTWKEGDMTPETFGELADKESDDTAEGGLYEEVYMGQMVEEFDEWIFDEDREAGDYEIVFTEDYGYHLILFVGENAPYWEVCVDDDKRAEEYSAYYEEEAKAYEVTSSALGIWYRNEPIK